MKRSIIIYTLLVFFSFVASAQLERYKAIFVYKFAQNFEWPASKSLNNYTIGVMGNDPLYQELSSLTNGRSVSGKPITIKQLKSGDNISNLCMLYLSNDNNEILSSLTQSAQKNGVVIIGDSPGMAKRGAPLNFLSAGGSLKFELNEASLSKCGVKASGSIKSLAVLVN